MSTDRLLTAAPSRLLGREHHLAKIRDLVDRTRDSHGGSVLVVGEAGIGKTALVAEALDPVRDEVIVVGGAAWEREGAPGYWPWVQVVRALERASDDEQWRQLTEPAGQGLSSLFGGAEAPTREIVDAAVFKLHDAVTHLLAHASRIRPVVIVLDDLHWADTASLKLLEFVVRHTWFEHLLVIGTLRDVEVVAEDHPLRDPIAALQAKSTTVTLSGLDVTEVATLMERATGRTPDHDLAAEVHRRTGGNPFFVEQLASLWYSGGSLDSIPPSLGSVLELRLGLLPSPVIELLTTGAVLGREFEERLLAEVAGADPHALETDLRQAVAARIVTPTSDGGYAFVHDLIRETLHRRLEARQLRAEHARIVDALERLAPADVDRRRSDLATHAALAVPEVGAERALEHLLAAVDEACGRLAADEVAHHLLAAIRLVPEHDRHRRATLALDLGMAQHVAGALSEARATFQQVLVQARELDDARLLAEAALGLHGLGIPDPDEQWQHEIALLDEARDALDAAEVPEDDPLRVRAAAASVRARSHLLAGDETREAQAQALVELARRTEDDEVIGFTLLARHDAIWRPGSAPERVQLADEMADAAMRHGDVEGELQASLLRMVALLELGDPRALTEQGELAARAARARLPRYEYLARTRQAAVDVLQGRFDRAREGIDGALDMGERLDEVDRSRLWLEQRWALALIRGDQTEAQELIRSIRETNGSYAIVVEAVTAAMRGDVEMARRHAPEIVTLAGEYPSMFTPALLHARAVLAAASGDLRACEAAREALAPHRDLWIVVAGGGTIHGPYVYWLGQIEAAQERWNDAVVAFEAAVAAAGRLDARPWLLRSRLGLVRSWLGRRSPGDVADGAAALPEIAEEAADIGMQGVVREAGLLQGQVAEMDGANPSRRPGRAGASETSGPASSATSTSPRQEGPASPTSSLQEGPATSASPPEEPTTSASPQDAGGAPAGNEFRFDGNVWTLSFAGRTVRLPPAKGLRDLHTLLALPGVDVPAVDLLDPEGGEAVRATKRLGGDPILDEQARSQYRQRLAELDEAIEQATARHEDERAAELDTERQAILDELRSATGLAGRSRRLGDEAERARKTVTARIRDTFRRLDERHPELAEHLRATVSTGANCRYDPSREVAWNR
jgi:hypothetical protein